MLSCISKWSTKPTDIDITQHGCIRQQGHEGNCVCLCGEEKSNNDDKKGILTPEKLDVKK